jgi:hypothetical protein
LHCDVSSGAVRPLVPGQNRFFVLQQIHRVAHAEAEAALTGPEWPQIFESGSGVANTVPATKCTNTYTPRLNPFQCQEGS